jgi:CRISPR/Cas system-associated endonuclease/helicase Cas3
MLAITPPEASPGQAAVIVATRRKAIVVYSQLRASGNRFVMVGG